MRAEFTRDEIVEASLVTIVHGGIRQVCIEAPSRISNLRKGRVTSIGPALRRTAVASVLCSGCSTRLRDTLSQHRKLDNRRCQGRRVNRVCFQNLLKKIV